MGCASSKRSKCRHCGKHPSPLSRCNSVPVHHPVPVHRPEQRDGDNDHTVALTSPTLSSLKLGSSLRKNHYDHDHNSSKGDSPLHNDNEDDNEGHCNYDYDCKTENKQKNNSNRKSKEEFSREIRLAKTWSDMIDQKIPKTPVRTPSGEPETINAWELMEGLEDVSPLCLSNLTDPHRSFSFHAVLGISPSNPSYPKLEPEKGYETPVPQWLQISSRDPDPDDMPITDFDPEIISTFRKALEDISPTNTSHLRSPDPEKIASPTSNRWLSILSSKAEAVDTKKASNGFMTTSECECPPGGEDKVVIYFTSLRGVRKTYENCCQVRVIMKGLGIRADERDVSMDYGFREELKMLIGEGFRGGLPRIFVMGRYIGGVDEIKQLHEEGSLEKLVHGCRKLDDSGGDDGDGGGGCGVCEACGDIRFVPCDTCYGSCKVYYEFEDGDEEELEEEEDECGFIRCPDCNENGIIRCPTIEMFMLILVPIGGIVRTQEIGFQPRGWAFATKDFQNMSRQFVESLLDLQG
ncbi:hypothetical protein NE237_020075 [Protea cynaroides]|uniref:Glutaredoxin domain-containing protein n=1 Tax=Protea cynaroides TaxID=273540 RepID=A0A9Q0H6J0_9MAGN|nr:hypothetical protein NE237_020075 [Protea cynaroides]